MKSVFSQLVYAPSDQQRGSAIRQTSRNGEPAFSFGMARRVGCDHWIVPPVLVGSVQSGHILAGAITGSRTHFISTG